MVQTWLQPRVAILDVTNPDAIDWFVRRLRTLQEEVGLDGFKFDAGEPCFLPFGCHTFRPLRHPAEYTNLYVTRVASKFPLGEMRSGYLTQSVPMFTRMGDKFSSFSVENGLGSLIPTLLTSGILGYPFSLPDMVGGNAYFLDMPTKDLVVRWAQANALMPAIQFSIAPWDLRGGSWWFAKFLDWLLNLFRDTKEEAIETSDCVRKALALRERFQSVLASEMDLAASTLEPICRPVWWASPRDPETFTIDDQFLVGDSLLVAPQLVDGARSRNVYLPEGSWRRVDLDLAEVGVEVGPVWLRHVTTELATVPVYERVS
jgi:alpha-glucosidase (family GH31 glycosyl hydrolase)